MPSTFGWGVSCIAVCTFLPEKAAITTGREEFSGRRKQNNDETAFCFKSTKILCGTYVMDDLSGETMGNLIYLSTMSKKCHNP